MNDMSSYSQGVATVEIIFLWLFAFLAGFFLCKLLRLLGLFKGKKPAVTETQQVLLTGTFPEIPAPSPSVMAPKSNKATVPAAPGVNTAALLNVNLNRAIKGDAGMGYEADIHSLIHARKSGEQVGYSPQRSVSPSASLKKAASTPIDTSKRSTRLERTTVVPAPAKPKTTPAVAAELPAVVTAAVPEVPASDATTNTFENRVREMTQPAVEAVSTTKVAEPEEADELQKLQGLDSEVAALLNQAGIRSYKQLANTSLRDLESLLDAGGAAFAAYDPKSWPYQAELAAKNNWDRLKDYQEFLSRSS